MKSLIFFVLSLIAWIVTGIITYNWLEPSGFIRVVAWLFIWQLIAGIIVAVLSILGLSGED